jgi:hypothetical protein
MCVSVSEWLSQDEIIYRQNLSARSKKSPLMALLIDALDEGNNVVIFSSLY